MKRRKRREEPRIMERGSKGEGERGQAGRTEEEEKEVVGERSKQVEKEVIDWTVVRRNKRQRKRTVQIFVKVNESKAFPLDVLTDDKVEDVKRRIQKDEDAYMTMQGKVLRTSEKLKSCGVTDGCTIQVTSRVRGGGHKDKKKGSEKKQTASAKGNEQKSVEEPESGRGPMLPDVYSRAMDRMTEENEGYQVFIEQLSQGSEVEMERAMRTFVAVARGFSGQEHFPAEILESGIRRAVEARRKKRCEGQEQSQNRRKARRCASTKKNLWRRR